MNNLNKISKVGDLLERALMRNESYVSQLIYSNSKEPTELEAMVRNYLNLRIGTTAKIITRIHNYYIKLLQL